MLINKQIKVDELPKDWLVLDHHVESGPVDFVGKSIKCNSCSNVEFKLKPQFDNETCSICNHYSPPVPKQIFGTKHIQLVAANSSLKGNHLAWLDAGEYDADGLMAETLKINPETKEKVSNWMRKGKDFFIYKVTEEKDVN